MVKSIILEEEGHLEEMVAQLDRFSPDWKIHAEYILEIENNLHEQWINSISQEVFQENYA